ncbi:TonB-dependent siderophore receptor [Pseudomonas fluorescens]|uniref:Ferripyoverdine receptor n=1 Tax=Pseudomonas fluorescens TaxID=294 RepID=A0A5E7EJN2_PSEFL|nr:TonB-dependent siderophore receptor [Pseudomonas fluorescens]VVO27105.1 Ferripyoverdine receptor [Pseudomonas fluorescens]
MQQRSLAPSMLAKGPGIPSLLVLALYMANAYSPLHAAEGDQASKSPSASDGSGDLVASTKEPAALELEATSITSNQLGTVTEGSGSYTPGTLATSTRLVLTPRQTPQSISVVTRQQMDDFGLNSIDDVIRHTPGLSVSTLDSERTTYYSRGFAISNYQYDGVPFLSNSAYASGNNLSDMAIYDRVEVIKGAAGLLTGSGAPGATINLIRKKPTREFSGHVSAGAGSWDNYRTEVDVAGPLTESGNIRGRAVAAYQDKHSFQDHYDRKTSVYYGILEADLGPDTLLTVGADYQDNDPRGSSWAAIPLFDSAGNQTDMSRSFNPGAKWSSWEQYTRTVFATLEHRFGNDWVSKLQLNHQINGYNAHLGSASGGNPDPVTGEGVFMYVGKYTGETTSNAADLYVTGPFEFLGREHELVVGASYNNAQWKGKSYWNVTAPEVGNFYQWTGNVAEPDWGSVSGTNDETVRQSGFYTTARFKPTDDLAVILGARLANYTLSAVNADDAKETGRVVPYAGVIYDLNDNYSVYASYTSIFNPQTTRDRTNKLLDPDEGDNYEVGIKGEFLGGRLNTSLAYFEIHEDNRAEADDEYNSNPTNPAIAYAYEAVQAKAKGIEAELSGELAPGWQAMAGYTHKVIRDADGEKISTWEAQDQVSLYTTYKLKGQLDRMTIGGGARWQNKSWQSVGNPVRGTEDVTQDAYWLVDLMTRYQVSKNLSASVNLNNLLDKKYFSNVGFYNSVYYGDPRNVMFSTRYDF